MCLFLSLSYIPQEHIGFIQIVIVYHLSKSLQYVYTYMYTVCGITPVKEVW